MSMDFENCVQEQSSNDFTSKEISQIMAGQIWAGHVECPSCSHTWIDCAAWNTQQFKCPKCENESSRKILSSGEELVGRIVLATVNCCGAKPNDILDWLDDQLGDEFGLGGKLNETVIKDARKTIHDCRPLCATCNGNGIISATGEDDQIGSSLCEDCGGMGRKIDED